MALPDDRYPLVPWSLAHGPLRVRLISAGTLLAVAMAACAGPAVRPADVAHFRSLGFACGDATTGAGAVTCRAAVEGVPLEVTLAAEPDALVTATVPQSVGRQAATGAWTTTVATAPSLATVRDELALWLPLWAQGGSTSDRLTGGSASIEADGAAASWTLAVDLRAP